MISEVVSWQTKITVKFCGDSGPASHKAKKALDSLNDNRVWQRLSASRADGSAEAVFVSADKLQSTIPKEKGATALSKLLAAKYPGHSWFPLTRESTVAMEWKHIVVLEYNEEDKQLHLLERRTLLASQH
jgi:hypothetical protein